MPVSLPVGEQITTHIPGTLRASYGFAYSDTDHYYIGEERDAPTETNVAPATLGIEHILGLEYDLARKFTLVSEIPFVHTEQSRKFGGVAGTMKARGLGDVRLLARYWISDQNPGLRWYTALGVRLPAGDSDGKFRAKNGKLVTKDLAAQAGTGNPAGIVEIGGGAMLGDRIGLGVSARYIFTPEATTVNNFRNELTGNGPKKNSDSDAATARVRFSSPLSMGDGALSRVAASVIADVGWVPNDDLIGETEGFRRAGPIVLLGPGLSWAPREAFAVSAAVPFAVYRNVQENGGNVQEWMLQLSLSYNIMNGARP